LSLAGTEKSYNRGQYLNSLFLTFRSVNVVTTALIKGNYIKFRKGSKVKQEVNSYQPTERLELLLLPLLYEIQEKYLGEDKTLVIFKPKEDKDVKEVIASNKLSLFSTKETTKNHTMRRRSYSPELSSDHPDIVGLRTINEYLKDVVYGLVVPPKK